MEKKRTYTKPAVSVIQLDSSPLLLEGSSRETIEQRFVDDDTEWEWDDNGAQ